MYASHVHFTTMLGTGNISARKWPTYITSGIVPWRPSPTTLIAKLKKKKAHSRTTTKHVALELNTET